MAPDLGVLVVSSLCLGLCGRLTRKARQSQRAQELVRDGSGQDDGEGVNAGAPPTLTVLILTNLDI